MIFRLMAAAAVAVALAGCASSGSTALKDETRATISTKLNKGMPKEEVRAKLGDPLNVDYTDGGKEIWKYEFTRAQAKVQNFIPVVNIFSQGAEGTTKELTILFDEEDRVQKYSMTEHDLDANTGIIQ